MATSTVLAPPRHYLNDGYGIKSWLLTRDHKRIALLYLAGVTLFFFAALFAGGQLKFRHTHVLPRCVHTLHCILRAEQLGSFTAILRRFVQMNLDFRARAFIYVFFSRNQRVCFLQFFRGESVQTLPLTLNKLLVHFVFSCTTMGAIFSLAPICREARAEFECGHTCSQHALWRATLLCVLGLVAVEHAGNHQTKTKSFLIL